MIQIEGVSRWRLFLPLAAGTAAGLMIILAVLTQRAMVERNELALEGRLLGLAHTAETLLRENGVVAADQVLGELLDAGGEDVVGLTLVGASGGDIASVGRTQTGGPVRPVELFLGRFAVSAEPHRGQRDGWMGARLQGRGRAELRIHLDEDAGVLPVSAQMVIPFAMVVGAALVWLAVVAGNSLDRHRIRIGQASERRRMEAVARAGAGLAHQLRTPLATIKGTCQLMAESGKGGESASRIETVVDQTERMNRLLGRLLDYARPPAPEPRPVPLVRVVEETAARHSGVVTEIPEATVVEIDSGHLVEILDNLLSNAGFFSAEGQTITIRAREAGGEVRLVVRDRGPGPGEDPEIHFEPYRTSRADGTGLGLPIARALAEANGGSLILRSATGSGCEAVLTIPSAGSP